MRRVLPTLLLLPAILLATPARAQGDCASVDAVWDSVTLIRKMQRSNDPALRARLSSTVIGLAASDDATIRGFAQAIGGDLVADADAQTLLSTAQSQRLSTGLQSVAIQNGCLNAPSSALSDSGTGESADANGNGFDSLSGAGADSIRQTGSSSVSDVSKGGPQFISGVLFKGDLLLFFAMLGALIALPILIYLRRTSKAFLQREERRMLLEPVRVRVDNREAVMTLVDISMNGFKLRHDGAIEGTPKLFVELDGHWTAGVVRWSNDQFAGVKFHRAISEAVLMAVLEGETRLAA